MHVLQSVCSLLILVPVLQVVRGQAKAQSQGQPTVAHSPGVPGINATFDYVIVGGGTAGLTVASRLAAEPSVSVAVVEAGGYYEADDGNVSVVPGYCTRYAGTDPTDTNPLVDWGFETVTQAGADNRRLHYARGKTLGGSSARNFLYYHRQTVGSAQKWAADTQDSTYTFSRLLPYYKKSVNYTAPTISYPNSTNRQDESVFDRIGGPLHVSHGGYNDPFATWVLPALQGIGQRALNGFQSGNLLGSAYVPATIDPTKATRSTSESSFLDGAVGHTTLKVYKNTLALRLLFNGGKVTGISVSSEGLSNHYVLNARREVIVSAGAFQSPQLLMVSGIGPRRVLDSLKIPVLVNLPGVGQNLWDHAWFGTTFRVKVPTNSAGLNNPKLAAAAVEAYVESAKGPLSVSGTMVLGFERLPPKFRNALSVATRKALDETFPADWPDLEFLPTSGFLGNHSNYQLADPRDGYNYASVATALVAPLSRGNISINSTSMLDAPLINPNWLTHPADIELAVAAFRRQRQVWTRMNNLTIGQEQVPGTSVQSDAEILRYIRDNLAPVWHAAATCKMGHSGDKMAVIDTNARVYGVRGLRVVDASSFPFLPPGHPQATVYALAEKISDQILQDLRRPVATSKS